MLELVPADPMKLFVQKTVLDHIHKHERIPSEMKQALKGSSHVEQMIRNLTQQYTDVQNLRISQRKNKIKERTFKGAICDIVELFIENFERHADARIASDIEKAGQRQPHDDHNEMELALQGKSTGDFEEMGLVIPLDQQTQTENHIKEPITDGRVISISKN